MWQRFESSDSCGVLDLELCLNVLRTTHRLLAQHAPSLPPFPHILHDVNDGKIARHASTRPTHTQHLQMTLSVVPGDEELTLCVMLGCAGGGLGGQAGPKSRIALHVQECLLGELLPNFSYNMYTQRFVRSPVPGRKVSIHVEPGVAYLRDVLRKSLLSS